MSSFINGPQIKPKAGGMVSCFNYRLTGMLSARSVSCKKGSVNFFLLFLVPNTLEAAEHTIIQYIDIDRIES